MDEERKQKHLEDADRVLADVREHLEWTVEQGEIYELKALQLLLQVTKSLHSLHDIQQVITLILDSALSFADADRAFLMMWNGDNTPRFKMGRSYNREYLSEDDFVISSSVIEQAMAGQQPIILTDAQSDEHFGKRQSIVGLNLRTIMAAPLRYEGKILGLLYVDSKRPLMRYTRHHLNVLTSLADQAAVAIHNAKKFETHGS
jgi:Nif-specific regulatory protein